MGRELVGRLREPVMCGGIEWWCDGNGGHRRKKIASCIYLSVNTLLYAFGKAIRIGFASPTYHPALCDDLQMRPISDVRKSGCCLGVLRTDLRR